MEPVNETQNKKIDLGLIGLDANSFFLMAAFSAQAIKEGWTQAQIDSVLSKAVGGDYNNLVGILEAHSKSNYCLQV